MSELTVSVWMAQAPEQVLSAFAEPFLLRRWYGAPPGAHRVHAQGQVAPGEAFHVDLMDDQGLPFTQLGRVHAADPERIVLEMSWQGGSLDGETSQAALCLHPAEGGTRVEVHQGPFSSAAALEGHRAYWEYNLGRLKRVVGGEAVPCFEEFHEESKGFSDPLGLAAYTVLAGLREAGAAPEVIAQVEETLYTHLARLPPDTAGVLGAVLRARLGDD